MREIDPQSEARLAEALRRLASSSPRSAPSRIGAGLLDEFRRYHARRRKVRRNAMLALALCIVMAGTWLGISFGHQRQTGPDRQVDSASGNTQKQPPALPPAVAPAAHRAAGKTFSRPRAVKPAVSAANRAFVALPGYDPAVPLEELQVVRVQLPASALWKIGAPVGADAGEQRMTADFVVNQDGTPYAVRLVQ
jgi:hypothetical protein